MLHRFAGLFGEIGEGRGQFPERDQQNREALVARIIIHVDHPAQDFALETQGILRSFRVPTQPEQVLRSVPGDVGAPTLDDTGRFAGDQRGFAPGLGGDHPGIFGDSALLSGDQVAVRFARDPGQAARHHMEIVLPGDEVRAQDHGARFDPVPDQGRQRRKRRDLLGHVRVRAPFHDTDQVFALFGVQQARVNRPITAPGTQRLNDVLFQMVDDVFQLVLATAPQGRYRRQTQIFAE